MAGKRQSSAGVTLIELMVVVAIASIILGLAVPSFSEFIQRARVVSATNDMVAFFNYGRSEAIKRSQSVVLCYSNDGVTCAGTGWADGAIAYVDLGTDIILRELAGTSRQITFSGPASLVFSPVGNVVAAGTFTVVGGTDSKKKRRICVSGTGRVESKAYSETC